MRVVLTQMVSARPRHGLASLRARRGTLSCLILIGAFLWSGCQKEKAASDETGSPAAKPAISKERGTADEQSARIAEKVMDALGGERAWNDTRYVSWKFMGVRQHYWDKWTGDIRIESNDVVTLMNINTKLGQVQKAGETIVEEATLENYLSRGYSSFMNESYWMFMPYKLREPGVNLAYGGERTLAGGKKADVLEVTFDGVGPSPNGRYDVVVDRESSLVVQWSFYESASDAKPKFILPWGGWQQFGKIKLATQHGQGGDWQIQVHDELPKTIFTSFEHVPA